MKGYVFVGQTENKPDESGGWAGGLRTCICNDGEPGGGCAPYNNADIVHVSTYIFAIFMLQLAAAEKKNTYKQNRVGL